jgi:hypothetical protein
MKKYFISRLKMCVGTIIILIVLSLSSKSSVSILSYSVALNTNLDKVLDSTVIESKQKELFDEESYNTMYTFAGDLTGYAGDCPLCSGYLACPPRTNVLKEGIYYKDKTYGTLRIAASSKKYPCGTIIRFNVNKLSSEPIIAIILDRGVGGNDIDLLTESQDFATKSVGRVRNLNFEVLREGWN